MTYNIILSARMEAVHNRISNQAPNSVKKIDPTFNDTWAVTLIVSVSLTGERHD